MSKYIKVSKLFILNSIVGSNVMVVVVYVYLLNVRPESSVDNFATEWKIDLAEIRSMIVSTGATQADALHPDFMWLCRLE